MTHLLLLGAGFSRNYGGWLADELTGDIMGRVADDTELLNCLRSQNGVESALETVRSSYERDRSNRDYQKRLFKLQDAIQQSFAEMNAAFEARGSMEFQHDPARYVQTFLARFDLIFTLNQDLLLERLYKPQDVNQYSGREWRGFDLPGMSYVAKDGDQDEMWIPTAGATASDPRPSCQPVVKLHGSVKWLDIDDRPSPRPAEWMLIMGTNKAPAIDRHEVLRRYFERFEKELAQPGTRLMVIGYSFRDTHINSAIVNAGPGLETFIVDPTGRKVLETLNIIKQRGVGIAMDEPIE